jgi:hypothetical protein
MEKEAGVQALRTAGKWVAARPGAVGKWLLAQPKGFQEAGKRLMHPIESVRKGWRAMEPGAKGALRKSRWDPRIVRAAKHLGQKGWTGKGRFTKYLPVGQKAMYAGLTGAFGVPAVIEAAKKQPTATGEGGVGEVGLGELAGLGGMVAGTGLGLLPAMALYGAGSYVGSKAGRIIDRLRGGANIGTAVRAPSRREAEEQLTNIARYHG